MPLSTGTRLGPYEILGPLGAGGMGEVYRAKDTRLDRTVAIKVLPSHLSSEPELKLRMEREAKAISSLQHANICTLHDIGSQDGTDYLVMEYLEGQTLADRLAKGPLPLDQTLKIATEIALALQKAHQLGIIHRDLKPANIMLTKAGAKLMDFGLAKPDLSISSRSISTVSPTTVTMDIPALTAATSPLTQKGSIVGTYQYLAPEILQGSPADARSDLFSFGCVLYEMITGRRAFEGKSQLSVFTAILEKDPEPLSNIQPPVPPALDRVVRACLAKDPTERFQSAHDVAMDLRWLSDSAAQSETDSSSFKFNRKWLAALAAILLSSLALAAFFGYRWAKSSSAPPASVHAELSLPAKLALDTTGDAGGMPVLSPQGDKLAFVAHSGEAKQIYVRYLNSDTAQPLDGTLGASHPFWSPDGNSIGFFAGGKLLRISANGGTVSTIADAPNSRGGSWGANDIIVFSPDFQGDGLRKVSALGGPVSPATVIDKIKHTTHRWPWFLPDGKHYIFLATNHTGGDPQQNGIYYASVDSTSIRMILPTVSAAQYASGYLLYRSGTALVAQPFDPSSATVSGTPTPIINKIRDDIGVWRSIFSVSQNGLLVYQVGSEAAANSRFAWFDRSGKLVKEFNPNEATSIDLRLSPDNRRVAFVSGTGVWTIDLDRDTKTRVTFDQQLVAQPSWSPDGKTILFVLSTSSGGGNGEIRSKAADGSGVESSILPGQNNYHYPAFSPDGKYLTYTWGDGEKNVSLWMRPLSGNSEPVAILRPPSPQSNILNYRVSPDSRWLAYSSDESGQHEIYVTSFPDAKGKWRISANGGSFPAWSGNSREIFYKDLGADDYFACPVSPNSNELDVSPCQRLFHVPTPGIGIPFDASSDGQHLLINRAEEEVQAPLLLISNWPSSLPH